MTNIPTTDSNPGDLKFAGQSGATQGAGGFADFQNPQQGYAALANQLQTYMTNHPDWDLGQFASTYAPPADNNDTAAYTAKLANQLGVPPNTPISQLQGKMGQFVTAVANNEGYQSSQPSSIIPTAEAAETQSSQPQSSTPWLDDVLGILPIAGAGILTGAAALQGGADPLSDAAAAGADTAAAGEGGSLISSVLKGLGIGTGVNDAISAGENLLGINNSPASTNQSTSTPPAPNISFSDGSPSSSPSPSPQEPGVPEELEQDIPQASKASQVLSSAISQSLQGNVGGSKMLADQNYRDAIGAMGMYDMNPDVDEDNRNDFSQKSKVADDVIGQAADANQTVLGAENKSIPVADVGQDASADLANKNTFTPIEQEEGQKHIEELNKAYADKDGNISLKDLDRARMQTGHGKKWGAMDSNVKKEAYKSWSTAARKNVLKNTYHKEFYEKNLKTQQNMILSKKIMKSLQGKKAKINKSFMKDLLKSGGKYAGIFLGDKIGGPLGAILGDMVGEHISRAADKRHGRNIFETKGMKAALKDLEGKNPAVHARLQQEIAKGNQKKAEEIIRREKTLKLPPGPIPLPSWKGGGTGNENKAIVTGGKRPPANFEQGLKRKRGEPEFGGLHLYERYLKDTQKAAGLKK